MDKKILHLLELPNISTVEIGILRSYMEMKEKLEMFQEDDTPKKVKKKIANLLKHIET